MSEKMCFRIGLALVVFCLLFLGAFNVFCNTNRLNSDSSSELLLARTLSEEGTLISDEWYYSTELRILNYQLVTTPLFMMTDNWHVVRAVSNFMFYVMMLLAYLYCVLGFGIKKGHALLSSVLLLLPFSMDAVDIIHIGGFYIPHFIILFMVLGLFVRSERKYAYVLFVILSFFAGISGIRYMLTIHLPLFFATLSLLKTDRKKISKAVFGMAAFAAGFICNHLLHKFFSFYSETAVSFYSSENPVQKIGVITDGLLQIFGFRKGVQLFSAEGVVSVVSLVFITLVFYLVVCKTKEFKNGSRDFLFMFLFSSFIINTFVFVVGNDVVYRSRYYFPVLIMLVPLVAKELSGKKLRAFASVVCVWCAFLIGCFTLFKVGLYDRNEYRYPAIEFLTENGYDFGYSTFWNANITTELTNGKILMAGIDEDFKPYLWLTPKKYYDGRTIAQKPFLLLSADEYSRLKDKVRGTLKYSDESFVIFDVAGDIW